MTETRNYEVIIVISAPIAFLLNLMVWKSIGYTRSTIYPVFLSFAIMYMSMVFLGLGIENWLFKGGTMRKQIRKTFRLRKLGIKTSGVREFFHTDFTIPEGLTILSYLIGLTVGLGAWILSGLTEEQLYDRVFMTFVAFSGSGFGFWYLTLPISTRYYEGIIKQRTSKLVTIDLEAKGLTEFSFQDVSNLKEVQRIALGRNELKAIDLSPLAEDSSLMELILYWNRLESIDLVPLASCSNLEYLDLAVNNLGNINLTPLASCKKLNALNLGGNETGRIDLKPLSKLRKLKILTIDCMKLKEANLEPLKNCRKLEFLKLNDNDVKSLDITPLYECQKLTDFEIDNIELTTTLVVDIETWPDGIRKHKKKIRILDGL